MAARNEVYDANGVLRERWDDTARTYTTWDGSGAQTGTRAYTAAENTAADALAVATTAAANGATLRSRASTALTANADYLAIGSPTNAQVAAQVVALTRQSSGLIRLLLDRLDTLNGA